MHHRHHTIQYHELICFWNKYLVLLHLDHEKLFYNLAVILSFSRLTNGQESPHDRRCCKAGEDVVGAAERSLVG